MDRLGSKVPTLKQYEVKLDIMNELKPELKDIVSDINKITDTSDVEEAKRGGEMIKKALTEQGNQIEDEWAHKM